MRGKIWKRALQAIGGGGSIGPSSSIPSGWNLPEERHRGRPARLLVPSQWLAWLTRVGTIATFLLLAGVGVWSQTTVHDASVRVLTSIKDQADYGDAKYALARETVLADKCGLDGIGGACGEVQATITAVEGVLRRHVASEDDAANRVLAQHLLGEQRRYGSIMRRMSAAVRRGDSLGAMMLDVREAMRLTSVMTRQLTVASTSELSEATAQTAVLQGMDATVRRLTILVMPLGLVSLIAIFILLHLYRHTVLLEQQALRTSDDRYRRLLETAEEGVWVLDAAGSTTFTNQKLAGMLGYTAEEMLRTPVSAFLDTETRACAETVLAHRGEGMGGQAEVRLWRKDGTAVWTSLSANAVFDEEGRYTGALAMITDITERRRAEEERARLSAIVQSSDDAILSMALDGTITSWNRGAETLYGYAPQEAVGQSITMLAPADSTEEIARILERIQQGEQIDWYETVRAHKDGTLVDVSLTVSPINDAAGTMTGIASMAHGITQRKAMERALRESEERYRTIFESASIGIATSDKEGRLLSANPAYQRFVGYTEDELRRMRWVDLVHPDDHHRQAAYSVDSTAGGQAGIRLEKRYLRKDGTIVWGSLTVTQLHDADSQLHFTIVTVEDITERRQYEAQLHHQALYDTLTDLPNRTLLHDRLQRAIHQAERDGSSAALLLFDLDRFKDVNDTFGHAEGDALLQEVARRMALVVRASDTVARLHGDEFALVLPATDARGARRVARTLQRALETHFAVYDHTIPLEGSIGIALTPEHGADPEVLLRHADIALYAAKRQHSGSALYAPDQDAYSAQRLTLLGKLRDAIDREDLALHFQPKVDVRTGRARHAEALLRWPDPGRGFLPPAEFIHLAEETGLINRLSKGVLTTARRQYERWRELDLDIAIAVNLSARNLYDRGVQAAVETIFRGGHLPAGAIELEITETGLLRNIEEALLVLNRFHHLGARIVIDDFGTGYSSLAYLARLPVDEIKIDRSFVMDMRSNDTHRVIVQSTIDLAHNLGIDATAEGVEDRATWDLLAGMGCDMIQGFYISPPLPADAFLEWITTSQPKRALRVIS